MVERGGNYVGTLTPRQRLKGNRASGFVMLEAQRALLTQPCKGQVVPGIEVKPTDLKTRILETQT